MPWTCSQQLDFPEVERIIAEAETQHGIPTTAGGAILEAVGDWLDSQDPAREDGVPSVTADDALAADPLAVAFDRLRRHVRVTQRRAELGEGAGQGHRERRRGRYSGRNVVRA